MSAGTVAASDFIAHDSRHYAKKVTQYILEKKDILDELPKAGKSIAAANDKQTHGPVFELQRQVNQLLHVKQKFMKDMLETVIQQQAFS